MKLIPIAITVLMWLSGCASGPKQNSIAEKPGASPAAPSPTPPAPQDREAVKKDLIYLANSIPDAMRRGNSNYISSVTTDDFQQTIDGDVRSKQKVLAEVTTGNVLKDFAITDERLVSLGDSGAVLSYTLVVFLPGGHSTGIDTIDTYVRQNGKWMLKSQQQTVRK